MGILVFFIVILLIVGITLFLWRQRKGRMLGALLDKRLYSDTNTRPGEILHARSINLIGKPDYLMEQNGAIIPIEVKTGKTPATPYLNHTMQLMAYCLLVEENFGQRPPGGIIHYPDKQMKVAYTKEAEESLRKLIDEMSMNKAAGTEFTCKHQEHQIV